MKKQFFKMCALGGILVHLLLCMGCSKEVQEPYAPFFTLKEVTEVTRTTAKLVGEVYSENRQSFECGFLVATVSTVPTIDAQRIRGTMLDSYTCEATLAQLKPSTVYYYCMYVSNGENLIRGETIGVFTTLEDGVPILDNVTIVSFGDHSIVAKSRIMDEGGSEINQYGFAYKTANDSKYNYVYATGFVDEGAKTFEVTIDRLEPETTYTLMATASNTRGQGLGKEAIQSTGSLESPTVTTLNIENITTTTCVATGVLEDPGKGSLLEQGFMVVEKGSSAAPRKIPAAKVPNEKTFVVNINGLKFNTSYSIYAYATSLLATQTLLGQGAIKEIKTENINPLVLGRMNYTTSGSKITLTSSVTNAGGGTVSERGFVWSTTTASKENMNKLIASGDDKLFTATLADIQKDVLYYLYTYATNEQGTTYDNYLEIRPIVVKVPVVEICSWTLEKNTLKLSSKVTSNGNGTVTERGFCWSKTINESDKMDHLKASSGTNEGFHADLTGIEPNTPYYICAYAKNEKGTSYSQVNKITPFAITAPTVDKCSWTLEDNTLKLSSKVTSNGKGTVTERGFCWSKVTGDPDKMKSLSASSGNDEGFHAELTGIEPNTSYYICAYAKNEVNIAYSQVEWITPLSASRPELGYPKCEIVEKSIHMSCTAVSKEKLTEVGFYYSTTGEPTQSSDFLSATPDEIFSATLSKLKTNVTYYIRAYAKNRGGAVLGSAVSIESPLKTPTIHTPNNWGTTATGTSISISTSIQNANGTLTAKGFCYSLTNKNPTLSDSHVECTEDAFGAEITKLEMGKTYYIRAYATNENGTGYSQAISQTTKSAPQEGDIQSPDKNN